MWKYSSASALRSSIKAERKVKRATSSSAPRPSAPAGHVERVQRRRIFGERVDHVGDRIERPWQVGLRGVKERDQRPYEAVQLVRSEGFVGQDGVERADDPLALSAHGVEARFAVRVGLAHS